jgi:endogenous inhibitor of DNA gyrase (YacG/DUF329 family)
LGPEPKAYRPFCGERCKMLDLARWLDEGFVLSRPMTPDEAWDAVAALERSTDEGA